MKARPKLTACTVAVRAVMDTYVARIEDNGITASHSGGAADAARKAAGHALRVSPERVVLTQIPGTAHNRARYTAAVDDQSAQSDPLPQSLTPSVPHSPAP